MENKQEQAGCFEKIHQYQVQNLSSFNKIMILRVSL